MIKIRVQLKELFLILISIKLQNTHNGVYIHLVCKGAHVGREYRYKGVGPILNGFDSDPWGIYNVSQ